MATSNEKSWFVYMVRCSDNSLYTGIAIDVEQRVIHHNDPRKGARYTRARQPVALVYQEESSSRSEASKREAAIKRLRKEEKERLVAAFMARVRA